jgi:serine/threonine-protein kinase
MDRARWERVQSVFHEAAALAEGERAAFLLGACGDDTGLRAEVSAMLREDAREHAVLDANLAAVAGRVLEDPSGDVLPREPFGPYRAVRFLGEGGMGVVYLGRREDIGAEAAIKILRDASLSPARRERFASEQRTLAQLNHPAIARLYDAGTLGNGTPWIAMEYVEGTPIAEHCERQGLPIEGRLRLFREVCEAVRHAHRLAIIHRDLKPSNVLVRKDGGVKLLDFGIAKQLESLDEPADRTRTALRLLTPAYAAPEQLRGDPIGTYSDVYSLGVMLYELVSGKRPFDVSRNTPAEAEAAMAARDPDPPSAMARAMALLYAGARTPAASAAAWADLDVLCLTAMHRDPQRRYSSVDALVRDIDHFLAGEPLEARPDSFRYRFGKFVRRHRPQVLTAAAVTLAVVALTAFYTIRLSAARNAALAEAARTQRIQHFMLRLFEGDAEAGPADTLRVTTLIDRGRLEAQALAAEPAVQAELYETLGSIYQSLGSLDNADTLLRAALEGRRGLFREPHPDVARSLVALGLLRVDQANLEEGERMIREGLAMSQATLPADHPAIGRGRVALGRVLEERGEYDAAIEILVDAVRQFETRAADAADPDVAAARYELGNAYFYAGRYDASDSLNRLVLATTERLHGPRHPSIADNLMNLGAAEQERGRYAEAEAYFRRGLELTRAWYGDDHLKTATNLTMLGRSLVTQNRLDEGTATLEDALAILERVLGPASPRVASALNEMGSIALRQERVADADRHYRRMLAIYREVHGDRHYHIGVAYSNLSTAAMAREDFAEGERLAREAIRVYAEAQGAEHINTGIARLKLGRSLLRQRRHREALAETSAGYAIVRPKMDPGSPWLAAARTDLIAEHEALGEDAAAAAHRVAQADADSAAAR